MKKLTLQKTGQRTISEPVFVFPPPTSDYWTLTPSQKLQHEKAWAWICGLTNPAFSLPRVLEGGK